jgi:hypothetical protein
LGLPLIATRRAFYSNGRAIVNAAPGAAGRWPNARLRLIRTIACVSAALIPLYVFTSCLLFVVLLSIFVWLGDGRYAERLLARAARIPAVRRLATRSYLRELEKTNPVAARAFAKLERVSGKGADRHGERAMGVLSAAERRAYLELFNDQPGQPRTRPRRRSD